MQAVEKHLLDESDSDFQLAILKTVIHVCSIMQLDRTILFSDIHEVFLQLLPAEMDLPVRTSKSRFVTFLGNEFGDLLTSFCHNKTVGIVFYRTKADPHALLSNALS